MGPPGSLQDLLTCEPGLGVSRYHRAKQMLRHLLSEGLKVLADPYSGTGIGTRNAAKKSFQLSELLPFWLICAVSPFVAIKLRSFPESRSFSAVPVLDISALRQRSLSWL